MYPILLILLIALLMVAGLPTLFWLGSIIDRNLRARTMRRVIEAGYPKPPTDAELDEFHRQVNVPNGCSKARD